MISRSPAIGPAATEVPMDFVFVIDEIASLQPGHDSSVALMEAAQRRGHRVLVTTAAELGFAQGRAIASCRQATLRPAVLHEGQWIADPEWSSLGPRQCCRLDDAAVVFMRTDPPVNAQYLRATCSSRCACPSSVPRRSSRPTGGRSATRSGPGAKPC